MAQSVVCELASGPLQSLGLAHVCGGVAVVVFGVVLVQLLDWLGLVGVFVVGVVSVICPFGVCGVGPVVVGAQSSIPHTSFVIVLVAVLGSAQWQRFALVLLQLRWV